MLPREFFLHGAMKYVLGIYFDIKKSQIFILYTEIMIHCSYVLVREIEEHDKRRLFFCILECTYLI